ncbi:gamma-glutamylcyclotransferase [Achromobacter sp. D10]|uniref:gamma-glutamylcyclotransferase n=1 Tax=Achromobacter sp. D10 TaxID=3110765 RepID=UPI002B466AB7|nr:gamma-glutamylcyclotransferase [Achromobacter sp. D10]MEB3095561.1 gamma-glutamylcyclotransferase [Achromobacter sp. D10]
MSLAVPAGCAGTENSRRALSVDDLLVGWNGVDDLWVFAYGSLIWHPGFAWRERRLATVRGYHRSLCLWSHDHRGSPDNPGLVFGLDRGGCCRGVVFQIAADDVPAVFNALWRREMVTGAYTPRWLTCHTEAAPVRGLVFLLNRACQEYAAGITDDRLLASVRNAVGHSGPCLDYVMETERALRAHGIDDWRLGDLVRRLGQAF